MLSARSVLRCDLSVPLARLSALSEAGDAPSLCIAYRSDMTRRKTKPDAAASFNPAYPSYEEQKWAEDGNSRHTCRSASMQRQNASPPARELSWVRRDRDAAADAKTSPSSTAREPSRQKTTQRRTRRWRELGRSFLSFPPSSHLQG